MNEPVEILVSSPFPRGVGMCIVDMLLRKHISQAVEFGAIVCRDGKNLMLF